MEQEHKSSIYFDRIWTGRQLPGFVLMRFVTAFPKEKSFFSLLRTDYIENVDTATMTAL